jgi:hypothetical protein
VVEVLVGTWRLHAERVRWDDLGGRRQVLLPLLLVGSQSHGAIRVPLYIALIEHLVDLLLHATELVNLLLHLLELPHLLCDFGLLSLLLELLLLDLGSGLAALC